MKSISWILTCACIFLFLQVSSAQKKFNFGSPSKADLRTTHYPKDSTAVAAYLHKECINEILFYTDIPGQEGFKADLSYKCRIKVYKDKGKEYTKDSFRIYINDNLNIDKLTRFTITTYNLQDGKIVKTTLREKDLTINKSAKGYHTIIYAAKDVYVGSIVDIQYSILSPNLFILPTWRFQSDIPTKYCFYQFIHPEFIEYNVTVNGLVKLEQKQSSNITNFDLSSSKLSNQYTELQKTFSALDIPAFKQEVFLSTPSNYLGFLDFTLTNYRVPGGKQTNLANTWQDVGRELLGSRHFAGLLFEGAFMEEDIANLVQPIEQTKEKALAVYKHIQDKVTWNKVQGLGSFSTIQSVYKKGVGNITDINLLLVAAFKKAGLKAFPVVLSTRKHGFINPQNPSIFSFNYVIAGIEIEDGTLHFFDAADPFGTLDILPEYCLNGQALRLGQYSNWVDLPHKKREVESIVSKIVLDQDGLATGSLKYVGKDYAARQLRQIWHASDNQNRFFKYLERTYNGLLIKSGEVKYIEDNNKAIELDLLIRLKGRYKINTESATFTPIYMGDFSENPFKAETRTYPIYFDLPKKKSYVLTIGIPEGYSVKSLPQSEIIRLPNKAGQFSFSTSIVGETIQIIYSYKLNATYFPSSMYTELKAFYDAILRKQGESVIFKKD